MVRTVLTVRVAGPIEPVVDRIECSSRPCHADRSPQSSSSASADRIKDLGAFQGIRSNQLTATAWSSGCRGPVTRISNIPIQSVKAVASRFGLQPAAGINPGLKNAAVVMITAELPPFAKPGQKIDITVASMGKAKSLRGGA